MAVNTFKSVSEESFSPRVERARVESLGYEHSSPQLGANAVNSTKPPLQKSTFPFPGGLVDPPHASEYNLFKAAAKMRRASRRSSEVGIDLDVETQVVRFNVGGTIFNTTKQALNRFPETFLGSLTPSSTFFNRIKREYFFDRNPIVFSAVLDLYRTNELHLPRNCCGNAVLKYRELEFWQIPTIWVSACCWSNIHDALQDKKQHQDLRTSNNSELYGISGLFGDMRAYIWDSLYDSKKRSRSFLIWNNLIAATIVASLVVFFIDSTTEYSPHIYFTDFLASNRTNQAHLPPRNVFALWLIDIFLLVILTLEFLLKVFASRSIKHFFLNTISTLYGLSLLGCIVGHIAESILERPEYWKNLEGLDIVYTFLRIIHFLRIIRFFELLDRNASLRVMWIATKRCQIELFSLLGVFLVMAVFFGALVFYCEHEEDSNDPFFHGDLSTSVYWAIITMTTVGYGDMTPKTQMGRVIGAMCSIFGLLVLAMPVAILTESFQQYHMRLKIRLEKLEKQRMFFKISSTSEDSLEGNAVTIVERYTSA